MKTKPGWLREMQLAKEQTVRRHSVTNEANQDTANMFQDELDRELLSQLDRTARAWMPQEGESLVGKLVDVSDAESQYGEYPLLTLETTDKQLFAVHCFHTVLKREVSRRLERNRMKIGDRVGIKYLGREPSTTGGNSDTYMYRVQVRSST